MHDSLNEELLDEEEHKETSKDMIHPYIYVQRGFLNMLFMYVIQYYTWETCYRYINRIHLNYNTHWFINMQG